MNQAVVRQLSGSSQAVIGQSSDKVIGQSSGCHQAFVRLSSGCRQAVVRQLSGCRQAVVSQSFGPLSQKMHKIFAAEIKFQWYYFFRLNNQYIVIFLRQDSLQNDFHIFLRVWKEHSDKPRSENLSIASSVDTVSIELRPCNF